MQRSIFRLVAAALIVSGCAAPASSTSIESTPSHEATATAASTGASGSSSAVPFGGFGDDDVLAYVMAGEVWVAKEDGSGAHQLTGGSGQVNGVRWSPDGARLAFTRGDLHTIEADGTLNQVTRGTQISDPSWSPDGIKVAANGPDGLAIVNVDGGDWTSLPPKLPCMSEPDWGPNGVLVFTGSQCELPVALYTIEPDGTNLEELFAFPSGSELGSAAWSPDGTEIAFQADEDGGCIYVIDARGTNWRKVTDGCVDGFQITWSPDGQHIAWAGAGHGSQPAFVINADGTEERPISGLTNVAYLDWRPAK
jgi:TolB protein